MIFTKKTIEQLIAETIYNHLVPACDRLRKELAAPVRDMHNVYNLKLRIENTLDLLAAHRKEAIATSNILDIMAYLTRRSLVEELDNHVKKTNRLLLEIPKIGPSF
jgi:hypothetical protein